VFGWVAVYFDGHGCRCWRHFQHGRVDGCFDKEEYYCWEENDGQKEHPQGVAASASRDTGAAPGADNPA